MVHIGNSGQLLSESFFLNAFLVENFTYSSVDSFLMLEKHTAQGLFRKQFLILQLLFLSTQRERGILVPSGTISRVLFSKFKVTFTSLLSDAKIIIVYVNNGKVEGFTIQNAPLGFLNTYFQDICWQNRPFHFFCQLI